MKTKLDEIMANYLKNIGKLSTSKPRPLSLEHNSYKDTTACFSPCPFGSKDKREHSRQPGVVKRIILSGNKKTND